MSSDLDDLIGDANAVSISLAGAGLVVLGDTYFTFGGSAVRHPIAASNNNPLFAMGNDVQVQLLDHSRSNNKDVTFAATTTDDPRGWEISYESGKRQTVHIHNAAAAVGGTNLFINNAIGRRQTLAGSRSNTPVYRSWASQNRTGRDRSGVSNANRNFYQDIVNYTNQHTSSVGVQHINTGNVHLGLVPNSPHTTHTGLALRLSLHGLTGGSTSRAKQGFRRTNDDDNPMLYLSNRNVIWYIDNIQDVNGNSYAVAVRAHPTLPRASFGSFNTSSGNNCGYDYPVDFLAGWRTHTSSGSVWSARPRTYLEAQDLGGDNIITDPVGFFRGLTLVSPVEDGNSPASTAWSEQITRGFSGDTDGYEYMCIHEMATVTAPESTWQGESTPRYFAPLLYDNAEINSVNPTAHPQGDFNINGAEDQPFFVNNVTVDQSVQTPRVLGGIQGDAQNSYLNLLGRRITEAANDDTIAKGADYAALRNSAELWTYSVVETDPASTVANAAAHSLLFLIDNAPPPQVGTGNSIYAFLRTPATIMQRGSVGPETAWDVTNNGPVAFADANSEVTAEGSESTIRDTLEITYSPYTTTLIDYIAGQSYTAGTRVRASRAPTSTDQELNETDFLYQAAQDIPSGNTVHPSTPNSNLWTQLTQVYTQEFPDTNRNWDDTDPGVQVDAYDEIVFGLAFENTFFTSSTRNAGISVGNSTNLTVTFFFDRDEEGLRFFNSLNVNASGNPSEDIIFNWYQGTPQESRIAGTSAATITFNRAVTPTLPNVTIVFPNVSEHSAFTNSIPNVNLGPDNLLAIGDRNEFLNSFDVLVRQDGSGVELMSRIRERHPVVATARIISGPTGAVPNRRATGSTLRFRDGFPDIFEGRSNVHNTLSILENLNDVSIASDVQNGQVLEYENGVWRNSEQVFGLDLLNISEDPDSTPANPIIDIETQSPTGTLDLNDVLRLSASVASVEFDQNVALTPLTSERRAVLSINDTATGSGTTTTGALFAPGETATFQQVLVLSDTPVNLRTQFYASGGVRLNQNDRVAFANGLANAIRFAIGGLPTGYSVVTHHFPTRSDVIIEDSNDPQVGGGIDWRILQNIIPGEVSVSGRGLNAGGVGTLTVQAGDHIASAQWLLVPQNRQGTDLNPLQGVSVTTDSATIDAASLRGQLITQARAAWPRYTIDELPTGVRVTGPLGQSFRMLTSDYSGADVRAVVTQGDATANADFALTLL